MMIPLDDESYSGHRCRQQNIITIHANLIAANVHFPFHIHLLNSVLTLSARDSNSFEIMTRI